MIEVEVGLLEVEVELSAEGLGPLFLVLKTSGRAQEGILAPKMVFYVWGTPEGPPKTSESTWITKSH